VLPIWDGATWYGCLALFSPSADAFNPREVQQLQGIADAISTALGRYPQGLTR
jgi:GAF domain-containing protein